MARETSASESSTQIAESHSWFDVNTEVCLTPFFPHKHPTLIGRHTGHNNLAAAKGHKLECLNAWCGDSMGGMPG